MAAAEFSGTAEGVDLAEVEAGLESPVGVAVLLSELVGLELESLAASFLPHLSRMLVVQAFCSVASPTCSRLHWSAASWQMYYTSEGRVSVQVPLWSWRHVERVR